MSAEERIHGGRDSFKGVTGKWYDWNSAGDTMLHILRCAQILFTDAVWGYSWNKNRGSGGRGKKEIQTDRCRAKNAVDSRQRVLLFPQGSIRAT